MIKIMLEKKNLVNKKGGGNGLSVVGHVQGSDCQAQLKYTYLIFETINF